MSGQNSVIGCRDAVQDPLEDLVGSAARKCLLMRQQLIQHGADGENVRASVDGGRP